MENKEFGHEARDSDALLADAVNWVKNQRINVTGANPEIQIGAFSERADIAPILDEEQGIASAIKKVASATRESIRS